MLPLTNHGTGQRVIANASQFRYALFTPGYQNQGSAVLSSNRLALHLYRAHREALVSYAGKLSGDLTSAEDIVQDAWFLMDRQTDKTEIREPLGYLRRIVRNLVFAQVRKSRETTVDPASIPEIADARPSAEAEVIARQSLALVLQAIDEMPERQKAAVRMYHFDEMKLREVADRLNLSVSYTHSLIVEGMELCNRRLQKGR